MRKRSWIILSSIVVLGGIALYGYIQYQRTSQDLRQSRPDLTVEASTLIREFAADDTLSDKKYRKMILAVRGIVRSVDTTNNGVSVILKDPLQSASIRFSMEAPFNDFSAIHPGMQVIIKGILNGFNKDQTGLLGDEIVFNRAVWVQAQ